MAQASAWPLLTVEQAVGLALHAASPPLPMERRAPAAAARARAALAAPLHAPRAVPPFAASIKDGYAVRAADCAAPGADGAVTLAVAGASRAGDSDSESIGRLPALAASYITTGAPLPDGADAVVQVENVTLADDGQSVRVPAGIAAGQDVRQEGSDVAVGSEVIASGTVLTPADVGLAAMCGAAEVEVYGTPLVGVASTGNELFDSAAGAKGGADGAAAPGASQIYDANRPMLLAAVEAAVGDARDYGIICDTRDAVERVVDAAAADGADMLILSGGVSMGDRDYVKGVLSARGQVLCGRVLMKPGKPLTVATVPSEASRNGSMLVLGLPGNPVSALATFALVGAPALRALAGHPVGTQRMPRVRCVLETAIKLDRERPEYHRAVLTWRARENRYSAASTGRQISSRLGSFRGANALLELPRGAGELAAGTEVSALLLGDLGAAPASDAAMPTLPARAPLVPSGGGGAS